MADPRTADEAIDAWQTVQLSRRFVRESGIASHVRFHRPEQSDWQAVDVPHDQRLYWYVICGCIQHDLFVALPQHPAMPFDAAEVRLDRHHSVWSHQVYSPTLRAHVPIFTIGEYWIWLGQCCRCSTIYCSVSGCR